MMWYDITRNIKIGDVKKCQKKHLIKNLRPLAVIVSMELPPFTVTKFSAKKEE